MTTPQSPDDNPDREALALIVYQAIMAFYISHTHSQTAAEQAADAILAAGFVRAQPSALASVVYWRCPECRAGVASPDDVKAHACEPSAPAEGETPVGEITCPDCNGCGGWEHGGGQDENGRSEEPQTELCQRCQSTGRIEARPYIESLRASLARVEGERDAVKRAEADANRDCVNMLHLQTKTQQERDEARATAERLTAALDEILTWVSNYNCEAEGQDGWHDAKIRARAALAPEPPGTGEKA